jgi:hypothetical protein
MRNSARSCAAFIVAALVVCHGDALAQTLRVPAPAQAISPMKDPTRQPAVEAKVPAPLKRSSRALASLARKPTDLELGRAVDYSASKLHDRNGDLMAWAVNIVKARSGRWIIESNGLPKNARAMAGWIRLGFATQRDKVYTVDFVVDCPPQAEFLVRSVGPEVRLRPQEGHLLVPVMGSGRRHEVTIIPAGDREVDAHPFSLFYVSVIPQATESPKR